MMSEQPATDTTDTNQGTQEWSGNNSRQRNRNFNANVRFFKDPHQKLEQRYLCQMREYQRIKVSSFSRRTGDIHSKELKNPTDVVTLVTDLVDPTLNFLNNMPKPAFDATQAAADPMKKAVNDQMAMHRESMRCARTSRRCMVLCGGNVPQDFRLRSKVRTITTLMHLHTTHCGF